MGFVVLGCCCRTSISFVHLIRGLREYCCMQASSNHPETHKLKHNDTGALLLTRAIVLSSLMLGADSGWLVSSPHVILVESQSTALGTAATTPDDAPRRLLVSTNLVTPSQAMEPCRSLPQPLHVSLQNATVRASCATVRPTLHPNRDAQDRVVATPN